MCAGRRQATSAFVVALLGLAVAPNAVWAADPGAASKAAVSLQASFPELAVAPRAPGPPVGVAVDEYVGADIARLVDARGRRSLLLSSMPLRSRVGDGRLRPLSLALRSGAPGHVEPDNPVAEIRIATDPSRGFTLGPDARRLVTIVPLGVLADAPAGAAFAGQMLFAGARPDTDLLIRPGPAGVQTFEQVNGAAAPESFAYRLELSDGQSAQLTDGMVSVRQGGEVIVRSLPPIAIDADHRRVPVAISLADNVVRLDVPHRGRGLRYPIAVDPDWTSTYDYYEQPGLGVEGWYAEGQVPETPPAYYNAAINRNWDGTEAGRDTLGFVIKPIASPAGRIFPTGVGAQLVFNAPGTTRIRSITYRNVFRLNDRDRQTLRFVLRGLNFRENNDVFEAEAESFDDVTLPSIPFAEDVQTPATQAAMWMFSSPCEPGDLNCPPIIDSDMSRTLLKVGSVDLVLTDFDFPTTDATGTLRDLQDRWTNVTDSRTLNPSAIDEGSGVRDLSLTLDDPNATSTLLRSFESPCHPDHDVPGQDSTICPRTLDFDTPFSVDMSRLLDGRSTFTVDASDLADNTATAGGGATAFSVYLDRRAPTSIVSGPLYDAADTWSRPAGPSQLTVTATDTAGGAGRTSGIAHNLLSAVDRQGSTVLSRDADTCTPPGPITAPCDPGKATTFTLSPQQLPEGPVTFSAASRDLAGNDSDPVTWTVRLDRTPPAARASGDLLALTSRHTNSTTPTGVTLQGRDGASGVARLQLIASNSNGEQVLADRDTCTARDIDPTDGACPHNPSVAVTVDPARLPDGPTTFIARAIDRAGIRSVDNQDWETYVDHTPPDPPDSVSINQTSSTAIQITWPTVVDQPLGSGSVSYEYLITAGGQPIGGWRPTTNPHAQVSDLPPGVTISVQVRAIDAARNIGRPTRRDLTLYGVGRILASCVVKEARGNLDSTPFLASAGGEAGIQVKSALEAYCFPRPGTGPDGDVAVQATTLTVRLCMRAHDRTVLGTIDRQLACATKSRRAPSARNPLRMSVAALCRPGNTSYYAAAITKASGYEGSPESRRTVAVKLPCNESGAWRYQATHDPPTSNPAASLGIDLRLPGPDHDGLPPHGAAGTLNRGWRPHHIIPAEENRPARRLKRQANRAQRLGYICGIKPNDAVNGVWLRGFRLRGDQTGYRNLSTPERERQYHENLHTTAYYRAIANALDPWASESGVCLNQPGMLAELRGLRYRLIKGKMAR